MCRALALFALVSTFLIASGGCLKRRELIRVERDGSVVLRVELSGDKSDIEEGDPLPTSAAGWRVRKIAHAKNRMEPQFVDVEPDVIATLHVPAGRPLPDAYTTPDDPEYPAALHFPTTVRIERRADGTYFHFRRTYHGRANARFQIHLKQVQALAESLSDDPNASESPEQQRELREASYRALAHIQAEYVMIACEPFDDRWPQDRILALRQAALEKALEIEPKRLKSLEMAEDDSEANAALLLFVNYELPKAVTDTLRQRLRAMHVPPREIQTFIERYDLARARYAVTRDIQDESWEVRVRLPGEIVAHNADAIENGEAVWRFEGEALMDRDQVLMVTSRVLRRRQP